MGSLVEYCTPLIDVSDMLNGSNNNGDNRDVVDIIYASCNKKQQQYHSHRSIDTLAAIKVLCGSYENM